MGIKRMGRFGFVAAALGAAIVLTPLPAAAANEWLCHGTEVKRCAVVWWDEATDTFQGRAKVVDADGGGDYEVRVTNVRLEELDAGTVRSIADYDGWHDTQDGASTGKVDPCIWPGHAFSVVATFSWRGATSGEETWRPEPLWNLYCD